MKDQGLGLRTIKSALAVALAIGLAQFLRLEYPFFAGMTALIAMDKTALLSIKMARNRIAGTFLGAMLGVLLATFLWRGSALLCGVGVILLSLVCHRLHLQGAIGIGGIVMFAIMIHTDRTPMFYAINRTATTILGGLMAVAVNLCIFPYYNLRQMDRLLHQIWQLGNRLSQNKGVIEPETLKSIKQQLQELENELNLLQEEVFFKKGRQQIEHCAQELDILKQLFLEAVMLQQVEDPLVRDYHQQRICRIIAKNSSSFQSEY